MYWFRSSNILFILPWILCAAAWVIGGWLISTHAFRLERRERLVAGASLGLILFLWFMNLWGRWLNPTIGFILAGLTVLGIGVSFAWKGKRPVLDWHDLKEWQLLLAGVILLVLFTRLSMGTTLFDENKNLSIISTMATGDIPPHFYMNSDIHFAYHYGFQLLGASLVRLGGLLPWSAFDLSKAMVGTLAILMSYLVGARLTRKWWGGLVFALVVTFTTGTRYLLLLLPDSLLNGMGASLSILNGASLKDYLITTTYGEIGSETVLFPVAFLNQAQSWPLFFAIQTGPGQLSLLIFFLIWLVYDRIENPITIFVLTILFSMWALSWESSYGLFMIGGLLALIVYLVRNRSVLEIPPAAAALILSIPIALIQGGSITEMALNWLKGTFIPSASGSSDGILGFVYRNPPGLFTTQLGELRFTQAGEFALALFEIGPILLFSGWISYWSWKKFSSGDWLQGVFFFSALLGFFIPIFLSYKVDRDTGRLMAYSLDLWCMLLVLLLFDAQWKKSKVFIGLASFALVLSVFGGLSISNTALAYLQRSALGLTITNLDSYIAKAQWNQLEPGNEIFDPFQWRATVLTGLLSRSAISTNVVNPEWETLEAVPDVEELLESGYRYVYVDKKWWMNIPNKSRISLSQSCVKEVAFFGKDKDFRRLLDLQGCAP